MATQRATRTTRTPRAKSEKVVSIVPTETVEQTAETETEAVPESTSNGSAREFNLAMVTADEDLEELFGRKGTGGGRKPSDFKPNPDILAGLANTMQAGNEKVYVLIPLSEFPNTAKRSETPGEKMTEIPATLVSAQSYLYRHAKEMDPPLGVIARQINKGGIEYVAFRAKAANKRKAK